MTRLNSKLLRAHFTCMLAHGCFLRAFVSFQEDFQKLFPCDRENEFFWFVISPCVLVSPRSPWHQHSAPSLCQQEAVRVVTLILNICIMLYIILFHRSLHVLILWHGAGVLTRLLKVWLISATSLYSRLLYMTVASHETPQSIVSFDRRVLSDTHLIQTEQNTVFNGLSVSEGPTSCFQTPEFILRINTSCNLLSKTLAVDLLSDSFGTKMAFKVWLASSKGKHFITQKFNLRPFL